MKPAFNRIARRKLLRSGALLGMLLTACYSPQALAQANPPTPAGVQKLSDFIYRVWASNPTAQRGTLQLIDVQKGAVLYEERSARVSFGQQFNLRQLPDGHYAFVVKLGQQQYRYPLTMQTTSQRSCDLQPEPAPAAPSLTTALAK